MKEKSLKPICIIAARGGSKGVPNKNIRKLGNIPLIAHSIKTAISTNFFSSVIVSTENAKIAKISKQYGADVPFLRPKKLATDNASMTDVLLHTITKLQKLNYKFDTIVNRDCTVPFINKRDIQGAIREYYSKSCNLVCGVYKQHHNPYFNMMEINSNGFLEYSKKIGKKIKSRQSAPTVYQLNGLFTINVNKLLKYGRWHMPKILPCVILPETGFMIDTEFEFQIAEMMSHKKIF